MAKTDVILIQRVPGLGGETDQVKVAAGYARNYLIPHGLAIPLTGANRRRLEVLKQRRQERESHELQSMSELGQTLSKLTLVIPVKTGEDGKLFGSVTAANIADELKHQFDATVEKRKIHLHHPIKSLGEHEIDLRLHSQVEIKLKVRVESTTPLPPPPAPPPAAQEGKEEKKGTKAKGAKTERRTKRTEKAPKEKAEA